MSNPNVFMIPDNVVGSNGGNHGIDPNLLLALNQNGGFGANGNWMWLIFLWLLFPAFGGGWGNGFGGFGGFGGANGAGYLGNMINNDAGRELLMQAIQGNGDAIRQLSSMLGCKVDSIQNAICSLGTQIQGVGNQVGMGIQQVINSVQAGNTQLGMQIAQCCCDLRAQMAADTCAVKESVQGVNADLGFAFRDQTCTLEKAINNSTAQILAGQAAIEKRELQREIDTLREQKETYKIGGMINGAVAPLLAEVAELKCKLPKTETINVSPDYVPINRGINVQYAPYCGGFTGFGGWNGNWNNGCNAFQWG